MREGDGGGRVWISIRREGHFAPPPSPQGRIQKSGLVEKTAILEGGGAKSEKI